MDKQKTKQQLVDEFLKDYQDLCDKHKLRIAPRPLFKLRDDGTYSVLVQQGVEDLPAIN